MQDNILLTPHFALLEMTESRTAKKHGIENIPPVEAVGNLKQLCVYTMEPLREILGLPIIITSGYRSEALNRILAHSSKRSAHLEGRACDFYVGWSQNLNGRGQSGDVLSPRQRLIKAFRLIITSDAIDYDQLIIYPSFIHVSYISKERNRHSIMEAKGCGKYRSLTRTDALTLT